MVSEYVHAASADAGQDPSVRAMAARAYASLKRTAKAGPRRTVRARGACTCVCVRVCVGGARLAGWLCEWHVASVWAPRGTYAMCRGRTCRCPLAVVL
jgi:hypothetical protein